MAATVTNDELSAQARLISWRPSFLSSLPPLVFPVSLFSAPSWLSRGGGPVSLFIPSASTVSTFSRVSFVKPLLRQLHGRTGGNPHRECGMADDKSGIPLISAYDRGSVYKERYRKLGDVIRICRKRFEGAGSSPFPNIRLYIYKN